MYTEYLGPIAEENLLGSQELLQRAARLLQQGALVAIPTETTYGLAASILNETALKNLYEIKNRETSTALPIQVANTDQLKFITRDLPHQFDLIAKHFLPGPLTIVLKKNPHLSSTISGGMDTVAVRISSNKIARRLIELVGCPLAMPSANLSGNPSPTCAKHVLEDFNGKIQGIVDGGNSEYGLESTVLSLEDPANPVILRFGVISQRSIEKVLGTQVRVHPKALLSHFGKVGQQRLPAIRLFSSWDEMKIYLQLSNDSRRLVMSREERFPTLKMCDYFNLCAKNLYEGLRMAIRDSYSEVLVLCNPTLKNDEMLHQRLKQIAST
ncbi:L-threonylcarbamoyladenylate synthase [Simkania negevensis]|uniref:Threonylcarbamoyl-AMP synthase n=1 Tax=Simkania negevensis (strain ATCC VR-1471 / DSM 27360 / Z) TaxID=331113 RepID=F8L7W8_SIMNZ|nr:L-threonylcarbamoyladenylate synthase [Simkania negevensis]CCB88870.1 putative tRNA threonylcarbamoyladenosine biosynthesis protein YwlC [Simkania negevensis Z]